MKISTALILAIGVVLLLFEVAELLRERVTYPYRIDDIGLPWALMIIAAAGIILAVGLVKLTFDRSLGKTPKNFKLRYYLREGAPCASATYFRTRKLLTASGRGR